MQVARGSRQRRVQNVTQAFCLLTVYLQSPGLSVHLVLEPRDARENLISISPFVRLRRRMLGGQRRCAFFSC